MRRIVFITLALLAVSCNEVNHTDNKPSTEAGYFSIKDFAFDQWKTFHGQPFGIMKYVYMNGRKDSVLTNADVVDWAAICKIFFETDISDPKFLDNYEFSEFIDETTGTENYYYEAKDPGLFTRKLHIMSAVSNHKISSLYIETTRKNQWGSRMQRLYYEPVRSIVIQEFESVATGNKNEIRVEYKFL